MSEENESGSEFREKAESAMGENRQLKLENTLLKAGVDVETPMGAMFAEALSHRPELDLETVKQEWTELSGNTAPASTPPAQTPPLDPTLAAVMGNQAEPEVPGVSAEARESLALSEEAANAARRPIERTDLSGHEAARMEAEAAREAGMDSTIQQAAYFGTVLSRAAGGDDSVIWTQQKWNKHLEEFGEMPV